MTFSIAARCPETGQMGVAVSTALLCVGQLCPFPRAGVGAVATQSFVNPYLGLHGLDYLAEGMDAAAVRDRLVSEEQVVYLRLTGQRRDPVERGRVLDEISRAVVAADAVIDVPARHVGDQDVGPAVARTAARALQP